MKKWLLLAILVLSCGGFEISRNCALNGEGCPSNTITVTKDGSSCSTKESESEVVISCTDGTKSVIKKPKSGVDGQKGDTGWDGKDGMIGQTGIGGVDGKNGIDGQNGMNGDVGISGSDGYSSVFLITDSLSCPTGGKMIMVAMDTNRNGILDLVGDTGLQSTDICNGTNGVDGQNGTNGVDGTNGTNGVDGQNGTDGTNGTNGTNAPVSQFSVVSVIDPCGDKPNVTDEVMLKLGNGSILASFSDNSNGKNTRFSLLTPGSYITTDGSKCFFTIDSSMNIKNEHY